MKILITGAAGKLGSRLAQHLIPGPHQLRVMVHKSPIPFNISGHANLSIYRADLAQPHTLPMACEGIDCIVHFAGILFAPLPEKFLPLTNVGYVKNLVEAAKTASVRTACCSDCSRAVSWRTETYDLQPVTCFLLHHFRDVHIESRLRKQ